MDDELHFENVDAIMSRIDKLDPGVVKRRRRFEITMGPITRTTTDPVSGVETTTEISLDEFMEGRGGAIMRDKLPGLSQRLTERTE